MGNKKTTILIPFPESCDECPFSDKRFDLRACVLENYFVLLRKGETKPDWCPLVPDEEPHKVKDILEERRKQQNGRS